MRTVAVTKVGLPVKETFNSIIWWPWSSLKARSSPSSAGLPAVWWGRLLPKMQIENSRFERQSSHQSWTTTSASNSQEECLSQPPIYNNLQEVGEAMHKVWPHKTKRPANSIIKILEHLKCGKEWSNEKKWWQWEKKLLSSKNSLMHS